MNYSINPYQIKVNELNKQLEGLNLDRSCLIYDLNEYKTHPLPTVSIDLIIEQIKQIDNLIQETKYKISLVSRFIN